MRYFSILILLIMLSLPLMMFSFLGAVDLAVLFVLFLFTIFTGGPIFFISEILFFDKISFLLIILSFWLFSLMFLLGQKYKILKVSLMKYKMYMYILMSFIVFSVMFSDLMAFYIFFEISLVPLVFIILGWGYQVERVQAFFYLFLYTMFGSLPLLFFFLLTYSYLSLDWLMLYYLKNYSENFVLLLFLAMMIAFFIKLPLYGFHLWLPKAHVEAPVSGSMILAAVLLKLSLYGFYRVSPLMKPLFFFFFFALVFLFWGALLSSLVCLRQTDMKSLIAYSSVGHMGVMLGGFFFFSQMGLKAAIIIMMSHAFCSSALFYLVNFHYERSYSRQIFNNRGQFIFFGMLMSFWFLFLAINFSAPPFLSLVGELGVFISSFGKDLTYMYVLGLASFVVAAFCIYLFSVVIHGLGLKHYILQVEMDLNFFVLSYHFLPALLMVLLLDFF
ncbi:NADH dehydrogenase subunit 4 (mitochondrion) [Ramazzottius varieornatus]|uniref:NADH-ubiquinone oxidoreductase chain 4 n=1 Tax=Ramazzottius varieornatus TaxID=947166 RepID=A0A1C9ZRL2_RAMVA|nr:NADH dehydrogenase subunit 4 [Ramazzottius varieornatus]BAV58168.1 NADH dehydrogenase subunit 4 [Ramazzottius varieornatus]